MVGAIVTCSSIYANSIRNPPFHQLRYLYLRSVGKNFRKDISNFFEDFPELAVEFELPSCVPPYVKGERFFSAAFRVSSARTQLWTHYDVMDNVLCNVVGVKRICLWPPSQVCNPVMLGCCLFI